MTGSEVKAIAIRIHGQKGWQKRIALDLGVDVATVRRWTSGERPVPFLAAARLETLQT